MSIATDCHKITQYEVICPFLSLTEEQQQLNGENHYCRHLDEKLYHRGKHPQLPPLSGCPLTINYISEELIRMLNYYRGIARKDVL